MKMSGQKSRVFRFYKTGEHCVGFANTLPLGVTVNNWRSLLQLLNIRTPFIDCSEAVWLIFFSLFNTSYSSEPVTFKITRAGNKLLGPLRIEYTVGKFKCHVSMSIDLLFSTLDPLVCPGLTRRFDRNQA